jgi:hypothetical protein
MVKDSLLASESRYVVYHNQHKDAQLIQFEQLAIINMQS